MPEGKPKQLEEIDRYSRQQFLPKRKQRILGKVWVRIRMLEIQSIAIELADARGSDDDSMRVLQREDIQGSVDGIAERLFVSSISWSSQWMSSMIW
jgi:hypothetical protein